MLDIHKIDGFGISIGDIGILFVLFPDVLFIQDIDKKFLGVKVYLGKEGKNTITEKYLPYTSVDKALNKKEGLINFLTLNKIDLPKELLTLEDELFMEGLKDYILFQVLPCEKSNSNIFLLIDNLGTDFMNIYNLYKESKIPYNIMFSILLTFFNKSFGKSMNSFFNKKLMILRKNMSKISKHIIGYLWSQQNEIDFLRFLFNVNKDFIR